MKLSHKKKLASKRGKWWPFTRQMRIKRQSIAVMSFKRHGAIVKVSLLVAAAARLAHSLAGVKKCMLEGVNKYKAWLVRDTSQSLPTSQNNGIMASFCQQKPQIGIKIKINHKMT